MRIIVLEDSILASGASGSGAKWTIDDKYDIIDGTISCYDNDGSVFDALAHDDISTEWTVGSNPIANTSEARIPLTALKTILESPKFRPFSLESTKEMMFKAKHIAVSGTTNNTFPIKVRLVLSVVKRG